MLDKNVEKFLEKMRINDGIVVTITNKEDYELIDCMEFYQFGFIATQNNIIIKNIENENVLHIRNIIKTSVSIGLIIIETENKKIEIYEIS